MNRTEAIRYLHERHPDVIDAREGEVDLEQLFLDFLWLQGHVCERIDERAARDAKQCFETIARAWADGDDDVRNAVLEHFLQPDLVFHEELDWARKRMPPLLAQLSRDVRAQLELAMRDLERRALDKPEP